MYVMCVCMYLLIESDSVSKNSSPPPRGDDGIPGLHKYLPKTEVRD